MSRQTEIRDALVQEMVEVGELIRKGEDFFEDMGGHILHESNLDPYIKNYLDNMPAAECKELVERLSSEAT